MTNVSTAPASSGLRVALSQRQARAEMSVVMLEAMQVVRTNPRHPSGSGALRAG